MPPSAFDWAARYRDADTPWDLGRAHPELDAWLAANPAPKGGRALVPGCGTAHDGAALARAGWCVTAVELLAEAPLAANRRAIEDAGGEVVTGDALGYEPAAPFDLVLEHTFLSALELDDRPRWAELLHRSVRAGGTLVILAFPLDRPSELGGPPFGYALADVEALLPGFTFVEARPLQHPVGKRRWGEAWWRARRDG